jgi:hypothetical protein
LLLHRHARFLDSSLPTHATECSRGVSHCSRLYTGIAASATAINGAAGMVSRKSLYRRLACLSEPAERMRGRVPFVARRLHRTGSEYRGRHLLIGCALRRLVSSLRVRSAGGGRDNLICGAYVVDSLSNAHLADSFARLHFVSLSELGSAALRLVRPLPRQKIAARDPFWTHLADSFARPQFVAPGATRADLRPSRLRMTEGTSAAGSELRSGSPGPCRVARARQC